MEASPGSRPSAAVGRALSSAKSDSPSVWGVTFDTRGGKLVFRSPSTAKLMADHAADCPMKPSVVSEDMQEFVCAVSTGS